jgi:hypothetical protein
MNPTLAIEGAINQINQASDKIATKIQVSMVNTMSGQLNKIWPDAKMIVSISQSIREPILKIVNRGLGL